MCLTLLNASSKFWQLCMARISPVAICATKQISRSDPKFHLIVDGFGKCTGESFAILNKGCLFRVGLFFILCVVVVPSIR